MAVAAVVVSYHTGPVLQDCLSALLADPDIGAIVLVDNGNPPAVRQALGELAAREPRLQVTGEGVNRGFGAGCNLGAKAAAADRLLFLNPDAVLKPGAIPALEAARTGGWPAPVLVGGCIVDAAGREQRGARRADLTLATAAATFLGLASLKLHPALRSIDRSGEPAPDGPVAMPVVSGAFMYAAAADFWSVGGFDERFFLHVEDIDLCRRMRMGGGAVVYTPHAVAVHEGATSDAPAMVVERHKARSLATYFRIHAQGPGERLAAALLSPLITAALIARAALRRA